MVDIYWISIEFIQMYLFDPRFTHRNQVGWHLIYVRTSFRVALAVLRTPYVDRVYREKSRPGLTRFHFPALIW